jgi:cyclase
MRKALLVRLIAGTIVCLGASVAYIQSQGRGPQPLKVNKVSNDLYELEGDGGNVAVYLTDEGVIVIDDKFEYDYANIMAEIKKLTDRPVRYVLNTHLHGDHTGGNAKMLAAGVEILAHRNARAGMVKNKQPGLPRVTFADDAQVFLGGKEVDAYHYGRGHTNGDAVMYFPALKVLHTGDLFVSGAPLIDYSSGGSIVDWPGTLEKVLQLDFDTVIPGHGPIMKKADLVKWRTDMMSMISKIGGMVRGGASKEDVSKTLVSEFGWQSGGMQMRFLDGMIAELKTR